VLLSVIVLGAKYSKAQYIGAATILAGVGVVMIPQFMGGGHGGDNQTLFNIIFLCANVPMALSSVYKEVAFRNDDIDVNYLQAWYVRLV
jgi:drug/metabolite transporter (DMT)-like permease